MTDPVSVILADARQVGSDFCWPRRNVTEVVNALAALDQVVLGFEVWAFDDEVTPRVTNVSAYPVNLTGAWPTVVENARRLAVEALSDTTATGEWVQVDWLSRMDAEHLKARR